MTSSGSAGFAGASGAAGWAEFGAAGHTNDTAFLTTISDPSSYILPTYRSHAAVENGTPLVHLATFDSLREAITHARQLIFAAKAPKHLKFTAAQKQRVCLGGKERDLDHFMAHFMSGRAISGDFGRREDLLDGGAELTKELLQDEALVQAKAEAVAKLALVEKVFRETVLRPLEMQWQAKEEGGKGLFGRRKSSDEESKVDYKDLADRAGPLMREAKGVHEELEKVVLGAVARFGERSSKATSLKESMPRYA